MDTYDYLIAGGGAAASLLAARLADDGRNTVCVLEAGPPDSNPYIRIPAGFMKTIFDPAVTYQYVCEPIEGTAGRKVPVIQGRTVGGGGSVNGMLIVRGQPVDYDTWAARGNPGWSYAEVLPYFKRFERWLGGGDSAEARYRGSEGALPVTRPTYANKLAEAFMDSAEACGMPRHDRNGGDYNGRSQLGTGRYQAAIHNARRVSSAHAFLHPAVQRGHVHLRTNALVSKLRFEAGNGKARATGVDYLDAEGRTQSVSARQCVVVAAGVINSPRLLQLSGIGAGDLLRQHGIPVLHDLPAVGENLRDHYGARVVCRVAGKDRKKNSINGLSSGLALSLQIARWMAGLPSIVGMAPVMCYGFGRSEPTVVDPDVAFSFAPASMKLGTIGLLDEFPGMTCAGWKHRPDSTGHVRLASADVRDAPIINPMYLSDERDRRTAIDALRMVRKIFATAPLSGFVDAETFPGPKVQTDDEWLDFVRRYGSGTYHLTGTCRMGQASDPSTVVSPELKVHGIENLRVVDASVMPTEPSANTYAATLMIAEKAADMMLGRPPLPSSPT
jgi:choline dehydrogenase